MTVGERIKEAREKAGMTQKELGEKIGVSGVAVMRYEKGQRKIDIDLFRKLADALQVSAAWLFPQPLFNDYEEAAAEYKKFQADKVVRNCIEDVLKILYDKFEKEEIEESAIYILTDDSGGRAIYEEDIEIIVSAVTNQIETLSDALSGPVDSMRLYSQYVALREKEIMNNLQENIGEEK
ncbi:MAG: helix-turn-helix transcriptional regulator [Subdoligranulum sp.]|nr:helix-turn-helix transcriptional regulator [Subdoligranulum sp.]